MSAVIIPKVIITGSISPNVPFPVVKNKFNDAMMALLKCNATAGRTDTTDKRIDQLIRIFLLKRHASENAQPIAVNFFFIVLLLRTRRVCPSVFSSAIFRITIHCIVLYCAREKTSVLTLFLLAVRGRRETMGKFLVLRAVLRLTVRRGLSKVLEDYRRGLPDG